MQAEAYAIGIPPKDFGRLTMRDLYRCFEGAGTMRRRARQQDLWTAWHIANLTNAKKLPDLASLMHKLEPAESRVMSPKLMRGVILALADAYGAKVTYRKKGETIQ